jgi:hypothetical protein
MLLVFGFRRYFRRFVRPFGFRFISGLVERLRFLLSSFTVIACYGCTSP